MKSRLLLLILLLQNGCLKFVTIDAAIVTKTQTCLQYSNQGSKFDAEQDDSEELDYSSTSVTPPPLLDKENTQNNRSKEIVECPVDFRFCFNIWLSDGNGTKQIVKRGCWQDRSEINTNCNQRQCIGTPQTPPNGNLYFCCCTGNMCNQNMIEDNTTKTDKEAIFNVTQSFVTAELQPIWTSPIFLAFLSFMSVLLIVFACFVIFHQTIIIPGPEGAPLSPSGPGYSSNLQNVDNLKVISMLGQGKYGTVWKGLINEQVVAVKIFPAHHKQYFINERNIYSLPLMDSPSILSYFGCDERRTLDDNIEHFLVLSLAPLGCVQDWLITNTPDYLLFCKMSKSICRGLSHLHTELQCGDDLKPCVCHRDLNTRNILVKSDLSCCIADFGFALKTYGSRYEYKGEMQLAETKSLAEVGTLRYMAPEILEGAVNLRDCETALKQIDVYSLGLVLWELSSRCQELYAQGQAVPAYKAPYEAEIGKNPSFEQMQVLVARHKARPLFPNGWGGGPAGKLIRDTCEDCWDHDAEARLTALCAEERIHELLNLRPKSFTSRGPTPPINSNNLTSPNSSAASNFRSLATNGYHSPETIIVVTPPNQILPKVRSFSSDTGSTVINIGSPSSGVEKNHVMFAQQIQPYQGRNPCQERNLAAPSNRQHQIFIEKSKKHSFLENSPENGLSNLEDDVSVEDLLTNNNHHTRIEESSILGEGIPKQNNIDKKLKGWYGVRALIQKKLFKKESLLLATAGNQHHLQMEKPSQMDEKMNLVDENRLGNCTVMNMMRSTSTPSPTKEITVNFVDGRNRHHNGNVHILLDGGGERASASSSIIANRRPSNLDLIPITVRNNNGGLLPSDMKKSNIKHNNLNYVTNKCLTATADDKIDKDQPRLVVSRSTNAVKNLNNSSSSSTMSEENRITRQRSLEMFKEVFSGKGSTERLRDPSQRVKTPGDVPASVRKVRASKTLSLYDDRMMDSSGMNIL